MKDQLTEALQALKDKGGEQTRIVKDFNGVPIGADFYSEYVQKPIKPQCSTHQVSTGEHCPGEPKHEVDGYFLCDKCFETTVVMKAVKRSSPLPIMIKPRVIGNTYDVPNLDITKK